MPQELALDEAAPPAPAEYAGITTTAAICVQPMGAEEREIAARMWASDS